MRKWIVAVFLLFCSTVLAAQQWVAFKAAEVVSAADTQYPIQSVADGIVVLDVALDANGAATGATVVRDIPSLTEVATSSVQSWKFKPSFANGEPQESMMRVAFSFRPRANFAAGPKFKPLVSDAESDPNDATGFVPPGIISVGGYPEFPINAAFAGAVVVEVAVGSSGQAGRINIIRALPPFNSFAVTAARGWRFRTATIDGRPVVSNVAIAFVFGPLPN